MNRLLVDCASPKPSVMRLLLCAVGAYGRHRGRSGVQQPDGGGVREHGRVRSRPAVGGCTFALTDVHDLLTG